MSPTVKILIIIAAAAIILSASGALAMGLGAGAADSAAGLTDKQRAMARIIENAILAAGFDSRTVKAAIANAKGESGLNPDAIGDSGNSVGLFQLNIYGAGHGLSVEYRKDPENNVKTIIERELTAATKWGAKFRDVAHSPAATVGDVTEAFCRFVERPKNLDADSAKQRAIAAKLWPMDPT